MSRGVVLNRKLVLESRASTPDGAGGMQASWMPLGTLWADVQVVSRREDFVAGLVRPRVRYRVIIRAAPPGASSRPRPDQRVREGARIFDILTVAEHGRSGAYLELLVEEGNAA